MHPVRQEFRCALTGIPGRAKIASSNDPGTLMEHFDPTAPLRLVKPLWRFSRPHWRLLSASMGLTALAGLVGLLIPLGAQQVVNAFPGHPGALPVRTAVLGLGLLFGLQALAAFFQHQISGRLHARVIRDLQRTLFTQVLQLPLRFLDGTASGDLTSRFSQDVGQFQYMLGTTIRALLGGAISLLGASVLLMVLDPLLALLTLAALPLVVAQFWIFSRPMGKLSRRLLDLSGKLNARVQEVASSMRTVRAHRGEFWEEERFASLADGLCDLSSRRATFSGLMAATNQVATWGILVALFGVAAWETGRGTMDAGRLVAFLLLSLRVVVPLFDLAFLLADAQHAAAAWNRLREILDTEPATWPGRAPLPTVRQGLRLEQVSFAYREEEPVLHELSFEVPTGSRVALVGPSGSGKSTVFQLLLGFYRPSTGTILLDGRPIEEWLLSDLRSRLVYVPQDAALFSGSLADNISYALHGTSPASIREAAEKADLLEFVESLPQGLDTAVGERGVTLSAGQRQRVALARAFLRDPDIILLDEATSSLDALSELRIQKALSELLRGRTALVIAHRLSTVQGADRLVVLRQGRIEETGTHQSLLEADGLYATLCRAQALR